MRLRRVELVIIGVTLAFGCFIGGYFTGRTTGAVSITPTVSSQSGSNPLAGDTALAGVSQAKDSGEVSSASSATGTGATGSGAAGSGAAGTGAAGTDAAGSGAAGSGAAADDKTGGGGNAETGANQELLQVGAQSGDGRININSASGTELMDLPGIGPALSSRIVDYRNANGPFSCIEDLRKVSGIGEKKFEAIKDKVTV